MCDGPDYGYSMTDDREDDMGPTRQEYFAARERRWQHFPGAERQLDYYTQAPLDQLEEWNESEIFESRNVVVSHGDLGVMVTMEFRAITPLFDADDRFYELTRIDPHWEQLCAVFGDEDDMRRLVIFHDHGRAQATAEYLHLAIRR
jgi:hypothetical protein